MGGYNNFIAGGSSTVSSPGLGQFSAKTSLLSQLLQFPIDVCRCLSTLVRSSRGFQSHGGITYKRVGGDEFDLSPANEESLTDFIDEASYDEAPRVYESMGTTIRNDDKPSIVKGSAQSARHEVPKLEAPPNQVGKAETFDISDADQDLL